MTPLLVAALDPGEVFAALALVVGLAYVIKRNRAETAGGGKVLAGGTDRIVLKGDEIIIAHRSRPLAGVEAQVVAGGAKRTTATRVVAGTLVAPGLGTAVGAMAKKGETALVVTGPTWSETIAFTDLGKATLAARQINEAATRASSPAPGRRAA